MDKRNLLIGDVVQIDPNHDEVFGGHFMVVTEPKEWGAQGYCWGFPSTDLPEGGQAFYRCKFEDMEYVGEAEWIYESEEK